MADKTVTENQDDESVGFGAAFDDATAHSMEEGASSKHRGQNRRLALVAMSRNAETLARLSIDAPEAYGEMRDAIDDFKRHATALLEVATAASLRMQIADCRENTPAQKAKRQTSPTRRKAGSFACLSGALIIEGT